MNKSLEFCEFGASVIVISILRSIGLEVGLLQDALGPLIVYIQRFVGLSAR